MRWVMCKYGWLGDRVGGRKEGPESGVQRAPAEACCWTVCHRVQKMVSSEPAISPRDAALQLTEAGCRTAAIRVQKMVLLKQASPRAQ
jgi:hypothetical protein